GAANDAGLNASDTITIVADSNAPSGQSVALSGGPWYTTRSVPLTLANGTDAETGVDVASGVVERASAPLSAGVCGSFGAYTPVTLRGGADTTVQSGSCYRYRYTISDRVGNQSAPSAASATAKVDTTGPSPYLDAIESDAPVAYWRLGESSGTTAADVQGGSD